MATKSTQVAGKSASADKRRANKCSHLCCKVPTSVPGPGDAQRVIHPGKDVFLLKVSKVDPSGNRRSKLELELVSPGGGARHVAHRLETREAQCEPTCCCRQVCCCQLPPTATCIE